MKLFNYRYAIAGMAVAWTASVPATKAYDPGSYVYVGPGIGYVTINQGSYLDTTSVAVQNSTIVTERQTTKIATLAQAEMVLNQISSRFEGVPATATTVSLLPQTGGNAGSFNNQGSLWASVGYNNIRENIPNTSWHADLWTVGLGYDYKVNDKVLAGLALTYSNLRGKTDFNKGSINGDNAYGVVPYIAFKYNPCLDFDFMAGYSRVNKKRDRTTPSQASVNAGLVGPKAFQFPQI